MKKGQLIGGIICIALSAILGVLALVLPAGKAMFMVNGENMPMVPVIVLAAVGFGLLASSAQGQNTRTR